MAEPIIKTEFAGVAEVEYMLAGLYPAIANRAVESADAWLLDTLNTYALEAPYNYLSWAQGGGGPFGGFLSEAQRAFVMAGIRDGSITIPYPRIQRENYHLIGTGVNQSVASDEVSMYYSMSDEGQTRMQSIRGWDKISTLLAHWNSQIVDAFEKGVQEGIDIVNRLGLH